MKHRIIIKKKDEEISNKLSDININHVESELHKKLLFFNFEKTIFDIYTTKSDLIINIKENDPQNYLLNELLKSIKTILLKK